jgi:hypothetical protein
MKALALGLFVAGAVHADDSFRITVDPNAEGLRIFRVEKLDQAMSSHPSRDLARFSLSTSRYPWHEIVTTVFWPEEEGNHKSAFEPNWLANAPHENLFFFALPYTDLIDDSHTKPEAASVVPWFRSSFVREGQSVLRGRWIQIQHGNRFAFATWADVGPHRTDDAEYVWFGKPPLPGSNGAALDVSPAARDWLGMTGKDLCSWRFVEARSVPPVPWTSYGQGNVALLKSK